MDLHSAFDFARKAHTRDHLDLDVIQTRTSLHLRRSLLDKLPAISKRIGFHRAILWDVHNDDSSTVRCDYQRCIGCS